MIDAPPLCRTPRLQRLLLFVVNLTTNYNNCCEIPMHRFWGIARARRPPPGGAEGSYPSAGSGSGRPAKIRASGAAAIAHGEPRRAQWRGT